MQIVFHLGAHYTDEERLLKCLRRNQQLLAQQGIAVPNAARYRTLLRDSVNQLQGRLATQETQAALLEKIVEEDDPARVILSWDSFLSLPPWVLDGGLYPIAAERIRAYRNLFPDHHVECHMAIRNPAGFLATLCARQPNKTPDEILAETAPFALSWSELIDRIRRKNPDVPLTLWCDEDTPLIWPGVLQSVSGHAEGTVLAGEDEVLVPLMQAVGLKRLRDYLADNPPVHEPHRRGIVAAFLEKYLQPDANSVTVDLPGWTQETVDALTEAYDSDVAALAARDDITFLSA